ncbi:MAG: amidohydrolase family protein [Firmicutes bacterium]|nr:amidohydrolase family protein [Bacillota bacterium]
MTEKVEALRRLLDVAAGRREADLYIEGGKLVNVFTGEIYPANVAVGGGRIAYVGGSKKMVGPETTVLSAAGHYLCPALIEPHYHPWLILNPVCLAETALCRGITTIVCDDLFLFVNLGVDGFLKLAGALDGLPVRYLWMARVLHQSPDLREDTLFSLPTLKKLFADPHIVKVAEITRWPLIVEGDRSLLEKICLAGESGIGVEGHTAGCNYDKLNAVAAAGVESCHEAITAGEVAQRLRLGFWTLLRHSSLRPDLPELLRAVTEERLPTGRMMFTADGSGPAFIAREGLVDGMLRTAVKAGVDPVQALQMATINPAVYLGLEREAGSIAPGRRADILLVPDLRSFTPATVISRGKVAAVAGKPVEPAAAPDWDEIGLKAVLPERSTVDSPSLYGVPSDRPAVFPVIEAVSAVITRRSDRFLESWGGFLERREDMLYCTLIDRFGKWATNGFVSGIGEMEAFASSVNTSYNLLVLGTDRASMARAAALVVEMGGGMALIEGGEVSYSFPLPLGGMMSDGPFPVLAGRVAELERRVGRLGYPFNDFLYTILFLVCDFLPGLRITASGILDVKTGQVLVPARLLKSPA